MTTIPQITIEGNPAGWGYSPQAGDFSSLVPTFGNFCGPGWTAGQRNANLSEQEIEDASVAYNLDANGDKAPSLVDTQCKGHDIAYLKADRSDNPALGKLAADVALLEGLAALDWSTLTAEEQRYASLMGLTFVAKIAVIDSTEYVVESFKNQAISAWNTISGIFDVAGQSYTDSLGAQISCTRDSQGNLNLECKNPALYGDQVFEQIIDPSPNGWATHTISTTNNGSKNSDTVALDGNSYDLNNPAQAQALEGVARSDGAIGNAAPQSSFWDSITQSISDFFVNAGSQSVGPVYDPGNTSPYLEPIGAFYDSQSKAYDQALSIADKTGVLVDSQGHRVSPA